MTKVLSRLSAALHDEAILHSVSPTAVQVSYQYIFTVGLQPMILLLQLVDDILSAACETVVLQEGKTDAKYRYVCGMSNGSMNC